jgi:hypothetical protein
MNSTPPNASISPASTLNVLQINLQRAQAPSRQADITAHNRDIDILLIQESYVVRDWVCGSSSSARIIDNHNNPKTTIAILNKNLSIFNVTTMSNQYITTVDITGGQKITFVSAYIQPPTRNGTNGDRDFFE